MQLVCAPNGRYQIVDDVNSNHYGFIDNVKINEQLTNRGQVNAR